MAGQAVAAWAVLIGSEGQVVAGPGDWAAPESGGVAGVLADAPRRHDFGAMGDEAAGRPAPAVPDLVSPAATWSDAELLRLGRQIGLHNQDDQPGRGWRRLTGQVSGARARGLLALAVGVFGDEPVSVEQLADLRRLADVVRVHGAGPGRVTVAGLEAEFRRLHGWAADAEVTPADLRDLVAIAGEAKMRRGPGEPVTRAHLGEVARARASQAAAADPFAGLPDDAVAVREDGTYLTVPSGIGVIEGMDHPRFFSAAGEPLGEIGLSGTRDGAGEVSFVLIRNNATIRQVSSLAIWYLAAHTAAPRLVVHSVTNPRFGRTLGDFGLTWSGQNMTGDTWVVAGNAAAAAARLGWSLRVPRPGAAAGPSRVVPFGGIRTQSGFYIPADRPGRADARDAEIVADEIAAAEFFPRVPGATVLHVHHAGGRFLAGGRALTQMEFLDEVMERLGLLPGEPVILVACGTAALTGTAHAVATLAMLAGRPVVGATGNAYTTAGGEVVTAHAGVDADGRMVIVPDQPAHWVVARPDLAQTAGLGADLLARLRDGTIAALLPDREITVGEPLAPPARTVEWAGVDRERDAFGRTSGAPLDRAEAFESTSGAQARRRGIAWNFSVAAGRPAPAVPALVSPAATWSGAARRSAAELLRQFDGPAGRRGTRCGSCGVGR